MSFVTTDAYKKLLEYAFRLLSGKNYSEKELTTRLNRRTRKLKLSNETVLIKKTLKRLHELELINDDKILENYFDYRLTTRPVGKFLFLHEMHRRGISIEVARAQWERRGLDEHKLAHDLIEKKQRQLHTLPKVLQKKKIASLLASRGFSPDTIWDAVEAL